MGEPDNGRPPVMFTTEYCAAPSHAPGAGGTKCISGWLATVIVPGVWRRRLAGKLPIMSAFRTFRWQGRTSTGMPLGPRCPLSSASQTSRCHPGVRPLPTTLGLGDRNRASSLTELPPAGTRRCPVWCRGLAVQDVHHGRWPPMAASARKIVCVVVLVHALPTSKPKMCPASACWTPSESFVRQPAAGSPKIHSIALPAATCLAFGTP